MHRINAATVDGIIAHVVNEDLADQLLRTTKPVVNLSSLHTNPGFIQIGTQAAAIGKLVADTFINRGLRHFAYFSGKNRDWDLPRIAGYVEHLHAEGYLAHAMEWSKPHARSKSGATKRYQSQQQEIEQWLKGLPQPIGIFAAGDQPGVDVINACRGAGLQVPEQIAVIGAGDDDLICDSCYPPLASVSLPAEQIGYAAAECLEGLIKGNHDSVHELMLPPEGVTHRMSSDVFAVEDLKLRQAMRFVQQHAAERIRVDDVARAIRINRRDLERRYRKHLARTPLEDIQLAQIERAKQQLRTSGDSVEVIANHAGFRNASHMGEVFRRHLKTTPTQFRKACRS